MSSLTNEIDVDCPGCGHHPTDGVYEELYAIGQADPVTVVPEGAQCPECGLRFVTEDALAALEENTPAVPPPG